MANYRRVIQYPWMQRTIGVLAAEYLRFVWNTSSTSIEPADFYDRLVPLQPIILATWHGQHLMVPFMRRQYPAKVLVSRHRDGEINATAAEWLGSGTIRGSGDTGGRFDLKGGVGAFQAMRAALAEGYNVVLTADVPKVARVAGEGIIKLAQASGRPIFPAAVTTSRRKVLNNWDSTTLNLPFSHVAMVVGGAVEVPANAGDDMLEAARKTLESNLNAASDLAIEIADGSRRGAGRG